MVLNSLRFLNMKDFTEINSMTLYEYNMRMKAFQLRQVDRELEIHQQAWANWNVKAMKTQGKKRVPVFGSFKQFFDYDSRIKEILGHSEVDRRNHRITEILRKQQERRKRDGKL